MTIEQRIANQLNKIAEKLATKKLSKREKDLFIKSILPSLDNLVTDGAVDFLAIITLGEDIIVQDWCFTDDAPLYDASARLQALANVINMLAYNEETSQENESRCEECEQADCPGSRQNKLAN